MIAGCGGYERVCWRINGCFVGAPRCIVLDRTQFEKQVRQARSLSQRLRTVGHNLSKQEETVP